MEMRTKSDFSGVLVGSLYGVHSYRGLGAPALKSVRWVNEDGQLLELKDVRQHCVALRGGATYEKNH